ncbi:MAG: hypothetical protein GY701_28725 [Sulfitobacter sp.]|nr:hypothetical protein [Sulfitobacter sp.]
MTTFEAIFNHHTAKLGLERCLRQAAVIMEGGTPSVQIAGIAMHLRGAANEIRRACLVTLKRDADYWLGLLKMHGVVIPPHCLAQRTRLKNTVQEEVVS